MTRPAENLVVGSGITGLLVARELLAAGQEVTIVERGPLRLDADSLPAAQREARLASTTHNTGPTPRKGGHPWLYGYAFGGSSLTWSGVAPRLLPSDFETRSRFGFGRDWPIDYDDLLPYFQETERVMGVSGATSKLFPGTDAYPSPPADPSAVDRMLGPLLEPFEPLPVARPKLHSHGYPPPLAGGIDTVEPSFTMLEVARELVGSEGLTIVDRSAAARLRTSGGSVTGVECVSADGSHSEISTRRVIAAAHGIENAALLLRSDLVGSAVGRWLSAHSHVVLELELDRQIDHADAQTRDSRVSYAWTEGEWRSERASAIVIPFNPGLLVREGVVEGLANGREGKALRREMSERFARTAVVYASLEDVPREDRFVELSSSRDALGLPRSEVRFPPDSDYVERGIQQVCRGLEERLAPLGARVVGRGFGGRGGHMLGTCFMGAEGVVDENLRHHDIDNLYLAGGSAFPTYSALHPTVTIAALALRLGGHLARDAA